VILNNSIALLEYKLASGIRKVNQYARREIAFTSGQGELRALQTASIEKDLRSTYAVTRLNLDSVVQIPDYLKLIIIAKPTERFSEAHLFMLDQYIMRGGNVILLVDPLIVSLDSINVNKIYIPPVNDLGLEPLLFKLGARLQPDLVLDLQCTRIPMVVGMQGERVQTELFPWYYHPLISSMADHPITNNLDRIQLEFPSSIDTIQTGTPVKKTILLRSSENSRLQLTPMRLNFNILQEEPDPTLFNKQGLGFAVMLEGKFESMFKNRLSEAQMNVLADAGLTFTPEADHAKVLVVTDGDIIKNLVNASTGETAPLGYNKYEQTLFSGNRDFILNAVEYMLDDSGVLQARSKDIKLRLLNVVKAKKEGLKWQLINILGPLIVIILMGWLYQWRRKQKFGIPV
jgi:ABC-2 type transport system permease protein